ncbi:MAG: hypothetical protein GY807_18965 [Gammaproteobacteria bacterium]|nr:hypothetical protein [Gammaproteobacteria bacterium]
MDKRRTQPIIDGLVLDMDLSQQLGTVNRGRIGDRSIAGNNGVVTGRPAGAFVAAAGDYASIDEGLITGFPFTVSGGFNTSSAAGQALFWCGDKDATNDYMALLLLNGDVQLRINDGSNQADTYTAALDDGNDHYVTVTVYVDGADVKADIYVDGVYVDVLANGNWATDFWTVGIAADRTAIGRLMDSTSGASLDGKAKNWSINNNHQADAADVQRLYDGWRIAGQTPAAEWKFDEGTGGGPGAVADSSGNGKHLAAGGMGWDLGENGGDLNVTSAGRVFDGVKDYIEVPDDASLRFGTAPFQVHSWIKAASQVNDYGRLFGKGDTAADEWVCDITKATGVYTFRVGGAAQSAATSGTDYQDDAWHLISLIRNGTSIAILVDGVSKATATIVLANLSVTKTIRIGWADDTASREFTGMIRTVKMATATKTIAQGTLDALALYRRGPTGPF